MCKLLLISMSISKIMKIGPLKAAHLKGAMPLSNTILSALKYVISFITLENVDRVVLSLYGHICLYL